MCRSIACRSSRCHNIARVAAYIAAVARAERVELWPFNSSSSHNTTASAKNSYYLTITNSCSYVIGMYVILTEIKIPPTLVVDFITTSERCFHRKQSILILFRFNRNKILETGGFQNFSLFSLNENKIH